MSMTTPPADTASTDATRAVAARPPTASGISTGIRLGRITLLAVGVALLAGGVYVLFDTVRLPRITGLAVWIVAAIVVHDAILAPILFGAGLLLRRAGRTVPGTVIAVVQGTLVVGSMMSLIVVPILVAQNYIPNNPSVLPLNYGLNLGILWLVLVVAGSGLSAWLYLRAKRANDRPSSIQA